MTALQGRHIHVSRLGIRAPRLAAAQRFRNDFEDALRTTTFPDHASGAVLYMRRLNLGRLRGGMSRQALSAHLARCLAATPIKVLRWGLPVPPAEAQVVQIPDIVTAAAFALRAALDLQTPHWAVTRIFPHCAHPGDTATNITETLRLLIAAASAAAPGRIAALKDGGNLIMQALEQLSPQQLERLAEPLLAKQLIPPQEHNIQASPFTPQNAAIAGRASDLRPTQSEIAVHFATAPQALRIAAAQAIPQWGTRDLRTVTLLTWVALAQQGPSGRSQTKRRLTSLTKAIALRLRQSPLSNGTLSAPNSTQSTPTDSLPSLTKSSNALRQSNTPVKSSRIDQSENPIDLPHGQSHPYAGFWLLIPVLRLLACDHAEQSLGIPLTRAVLGRFAARLGLFENDPIYHVLDPEVLPDTKGMTQNSWAPHPTVLRCIAGQRGLYAKAGRECTPLSLRPKTPAFALPNTADLPKDLILHPTQADTMRDPVTGFCLAAQRLITQVLGGHGWRWLVRRQGPITITPTHIDVVFDGRDATADLRIAGLDLNPGWVPALGRVIQFHYDYSTVRDPGGPPNE